MKRFIKMLLVATTAFLCFATAAHAETVTSGIYTLQTSGTTAKITKADFEGMAGWDVPLTPPNQIGGYTITGIGGYAFSNCKYLKTVVLPDSVTSLDEYALCGVQNVTLGSGLKTIADGAFSSTGSNYVKSITLSSSNRNLSIKDGVLYDYNKTRLIYNFGNTSSLVIPSTVKEIAGKAFKMPNVSPIETVKSVTIPASVETIGNEAFYNCEQLQTVTIQGNGLIYLRDDAFAWCDLKSISVPDSVVYLGESVFVGNQNMTSAKIPSNITYIKTGLFEGCEKLVDFKIPETVTSIGSYAFCDCISLPVKSLPSGLTSLGDCVFYNCDSITDVDLGENLTYLGSSAFRYCDKLETVRISPKITTLNSWAFQYCPALKNVYMPEGITAMNDGVFKGCTALESIEIPSTLTYINASTFEGCESLKSVKLHDGLKKIYKAAFKGCTSLSDIELPDGMEMLGMNAFEGCTSLTEITIPSGITSVAASIFSGCTALESVTLPSGVTSVGISAFDGCTAFADVYFKGTEEAWNGISIETGNDALLAANKHFYMGTVNYYDSADALSGKAVDIYSGTADMTAPTRSKLGCEFLGWATVSGSSEVIYKPGDSLGGIADGTALYGVWAKTAYTTTTPFDSNYFIIAPTGIPNGSRITFAAYKEGTLVYVRSIENKNTQIPCYIDKDYDTIKVFAWDGLGTVKPLCEAEIPEI